MLLSTEFFVGEIVESGGAQQGPARAVKIVLAFHASVGDEVFGGQFQVDAVIFRHSGHIEKKLRFAADGSRLQHAELFLFGFNSTGFNGELVRDFFFGGVHADIGQVRAGVEPECFVDDNVMLAGRGGRLGVTAVFEIGHRWRGEQEDGQRATPIFFITAFPLRSPRKNAERVSASRVDR